MRASHGHMMKQSRSLANSATNEEQAVMQQAGAQQAAIQQAAMPQTTMQQAVMQQAAMPQTTMQQAVMQQAAMQQAVMQTGAPQAAAQQAAMQAGAQQAAMQQAIQQAASMVQFGTLNLATAAPGVTSNPTASGSAPSPVSTSGPPAAPSAKRGRGEEVTETTSSVNNVHFPALPLAVKSFLESALDPLRPDPERFSLIVSGESGSGKTTLVAKSIPAWLQDREGGNVGKGNLIFRRFRALEFRLDDTSLSLDKAPAAATKTPAEARALSAADEARNNRNMTAWDRLEELVNAPQQNKEARVVYISIDEAGPTPNLVRALVSAAAQPTTYHKRFADFKCVILGIAGSGANEMVCVDSAEEKQRRTEPGSGEGPYTPFTISSDEWRLVLKNYVVNRVAERDLFVAMLKDFPVLDKLAENARALFFLSRAFDDLTADRFVLQYPASVRYPEGAVPLLESTHDQSDGYVNRGVVTGPLATHLLLDTIQRFIYANGIRMCTDVPMLALRALSLVAAADVDEIDWSHRDVKELVRRYGVLQWHAHESGDSATVHRLRVTVSDSSTVLLMSCAGLLPPLSSSCEHQIAVFAGDRTPVHGLLLGAPAPRRLFWEEMTAAWMRLRLCALRWYGHDITVWIIVCTAFSRAVTRLGSSAFLKEHVVWRQPEPRQIRIMALEEPLQPSDSSSGLAQLKKALEDFGAVVAINAAKAAFADAVVLLPGLVLLLQVTDVEGLSSADVLAECRKNGLIDPERAFPSTAVPVAGMAETAIPSGSPRREQPHEEGDASTTAPPTPSQEDSNAEAIARQGRELTKELASIVRQGDGAPQCVGVLFSSHPVTGATSSTDATFADNCSAVVMAPECEARATSAGSKGACANMTFLLALVRCMHR